MQLNVNENPYPPSPAVVADIATAVAHAASSLNRYPDREFVELRAALAAYLSGDTGDVPVAPEQVWAANGSNEVMLQLLQAFGGPGRTALSFAPTYSMYPEYARDTNTALGGRPPRERLQPRPRRRPRAGRGRAALGRAAALAQQPDRHRAAAGGGHRRCARRSATTGVVVVDEAYGEFRRAGVPCALELLPAHRNLVVTRTMSKAFAGAGLRLGYLAADPAICDAIRVVRLPYHLSAVTQAAALAALRHAPELLAASTTCAPSATARWTGCARRASRSPTPTPTSCCSAPSPTGTPCGRTWSTRVC